jgi:hypothetical protein
MSNNTGLLLLLGTHIGFFAVMFVSVCRYFWKLKRMEQDNG